MSAHLLKCWLFSTSNLLSVSCILSLGNLIHSVAFKYHLYVGRRQTHISPQTSLANVLPPLECFVSM